MKENSKTICPTLSPLAETLRAHVAEYKKTLALFEEEGTKELAEKLSRIQSDIETTEKHINDILNPLGYSLDTIPRESITPQEVTRMLKEAGSVAELDPNFEGGIIHVDIEPKIVEALKTWDTAQEAFKNADSTIPDIESVLNNYPWKPLTQTTFDVFVLNHGETTPEERDTLVATMDTLGYRPLTLSELMAVVITKPEYYKRNEMLYTYEKRVLDRILRSPCVFRVGSNRFLGAGKVDNDWDEENRFVFVRKS